MPKQVVIVGGGAAGFFAAIRCAELDPSANVLILEANKNVLAKVKISGGGRCNVTHACWTPRELVAHYPRGSRELLGPFHQFACGDTVDWFSRRGVETKIEDDGRMFPVSDRSSTIVECLMNSARKAGVEIRYNTRVNSLKPPDAPDGQWLIQTEKEHFEADCLMLATGSNRRIWEMLEQLGHQIVPPVASLFTFNIKDRRLEGLEGISVTEAGLAIPAFKLNASGPLLVTHWGLSGPGVLRLSAWGARELAEADYRFELIVNWLNRSADEVRQILAEIKQQKAKKVISGQSNFGLPARLWQRLTESAGIKTDLRWSELSNKQIQALACELAEGSYQVVGKSTFKDEFVTAGGVDLKEVDFKKFESKILPRLFMAGEVLNIDAITGGFNFQAAWTGGYIAGEAMARS